MQYATRSFQHVLNGNEMFYLRHVGDTVCMYVTLHFETITLSLV